MKKAILCFLVIIGSIRASYGIESINTKAYVIARDFVSEKLAYPKTAKFQSNVVYEAKTSSSGVLLGKFSAKNAFGVESEYVYKMHIYSNGGDWTETRNWSYDYLIIEDVVTGEQKRYGKTNVSSVRNNSVQENTVKFLTYDCRVVEQNPGYFIRIQTPVKLSKQQISKGLTDFKYKDIVIYMCLSGKTKRGQEYVTVINPDMILLNQ